MSDKKRNLSALRYTCIESQVSVRARKASFSEYISGGSSEGGDAGRLYGRY